MTTSQRHDQQRQQRIATLNAAAKAKSRAKTLAAERAIRTLVKRQERVTFPAIQREAGVSHAFLYTHPELRERIEHLRARHQPATPPAPPETSESSLVLVLSSQISKLKKQHHDEIHRLRQALERAHGENLDLRRELDRRRDNPPLTPPHKP